MDDEEEIQKAIVFYLSECLDTCIKAAGHSSGEIPEADMDLKVLNDILNALHHLEEMDTDENMQ